MGDTQKLLPDGSWEKPVDVAAHRIWVAYENQRVPVFSLEYEMQAYRMILGLTQTPTPSSSGEPILSNRNLQVVAPTAALPR